MIFDPLDVLFAKIDTQESCCSSQGGQTIRLILKRFELCEDRRLKSTQVVMRKCLLLYVVSFENAENNER